MCKMQNGEMPDGKIPKGEMPKGEMPKGEMPYIPHEGKRVSCECPDFV